MVTLLIKSNFKMLKLTILKTLKTITVVLKFKKSHF